MSDQIIYSSPLDPRAKPLIEDLIYEYDSRYGDFFDRDGAAVELNRYPPEAFAAQIHHIEVFRRAWSRPAPPRIALGRVIVPTDGADAASRQRYAAFAEGRRARTLAPQGERRILFASDLVGPSEQILEALRKDPVVPLVNELRLELPYDLALEQYEQILTDFLSRIAPELGWKPSFRPKVSGPDANIGRERRAEAAIDG